MGIFAGFFKTQGHLKTSNWVWFINISQLLGWI